MKSNELFNISRGRATPQPEPQQEPEKSSIVGDFFRGLSFYAAIGAIWSVHSFNKSFNQVMCDSGATPPFWFKPKETPKTASTVLDEINTRVGKIERTTELMQNPDNLFGKRLK